jgi:hypothetical protein
MSGKYLQENPEILEKILEDWNLEETPSPYHQATFPHQWITVI